MDDYGDLIFEKSNACSKFIVKYLVNKADFNKMISRTQGAKLSLASIQGSIRNSFRISPRYDSGHTLSQNHFSQPMMRLIQGHFSVPVCLA